MTVHRFTLIVEGADLQSDAAQRALYGAGLDDATFGVVDGVQYADVEREAPSRYAALTQAIAAIQRSVPGATVVHVEPDDLVTMSEIAERLGRTRESVRLLVAGDRGDGDFPTPYTHVRTRNRLWRWSDVLRWCATRERDDLGNVLVDTADDDRATALVNGYLEYRRHLAEMPDDVRDDLESLLD